MTVERRHEGSAAARRNPSGIRSRPRHRRPSRCWCNPSSGGSPTWRSGSTRTPPTPPGHPPPIPPRSSDGPRPPPRARSGAGSPAIVARPAPWSRPSNSARSSSASRPNAAGAATPLHGDDPEPIRHQVAEVPPVRPVVDEYRLHRLTCPRCRTSTCATLPPGVPAGAFGPRLRAILSVLAGGYRLGKRPIRQLAFDLLGPVDLHRDDLPAGAAGRRRVGGPGRGTPASTSARPPSAHIDETSWWQGRDKMWLWAAVTQPGDGLHDRPVPGGRGRQGACWGPTPARWSSATGSRATPGSSDASSAGPISIGISRR